MKNILNNILMVIFLVVLALVLLDLLLNKIYEFVNMFVRYRQNEISKKECKKLIWKEIKRLLGKGKHMLLSVLFILFLIALPILSQILGMLMFWSVFYLDSWNPMEANENLMFVFGVASLYFSINCAYGATIWADVYFKGDDTYSIEGGREISTSQTCINHMLISFFVPAVIILILLPFKIGAFLEPIINITWLETAFWIYTLPFMIPFMIIFIIFIGGMTWLLVESIIRRIIALISLLFLHKKPDECNTNQIKIE